MLRRFPGLAARLPWQPLGEWPTPVTELGDLAHRLGLPALWVKRDDLSGRPCGGNKVRKLELLLAEALARGRRSVVTVGGIGSNHLLATACYARRLGLATHGVVFPQPLTPTVKQTLAVVRGLGVELRPCPSRLQVPLALRQARRAAELPYVIGPGGSSPLGCLGHVSAGLELAEQVRNGELPEPDVLVVALGSGGTCVGLALGLELAGLSTRVLAVRVVERLLCNRVLLGLMLRRAASLLGQLGVEVSPRAAGRRLHLVGDQLGRGYGHPTPAALAAVQRAAAEGLSLETTYTGKAFAALLELAARRRASRPPRILFWNTHNSRDLGELAAAGEDRPLPPEVAAWLARG